MPARLLNFEHRPRRAPAHRAGRAHTGTGDPRRPCSWRSWPGCFCRRRACSGDGSPSAVCSRGTSGSIRCCCSRRRRCRSVCIALWQATRRPTLLRLTRSPTRISTAAAASSGRRLASGPRGRARPRLADPRLARDLPRSHERSVLRRRRRRPARPDGDRRVVSARAALHAPAGAASTQARSTRWSTRRKAVRRWRGSSPTSTASTSSIRRARCGAASVIPHDANKLHLVTRLQRPALAGAAKNL